MTPGYADEGALAVHSLLDRARVRHRLVSHPPTFSANAEAEVAHVPPGRVAKTVVTTDRGHVRLAVVPASRELDLARLRAAVDASPHVRLATEQEIAAAFPGFEVGAVPPLGELIGAEEIVDPLVLHAPEVLAAAGDHRHGVLVDPEQLVEAARARVADICRHRGRRFSEAPLV
ncbi:MAG TPA: YbaK/EbsC family protein [Capillimicrobium sp.]|nr:YbaK/EbsC family protein [Capillimicrobium sp.]